MDIASAFAARARSSAPLTRPCPSACSRPTGIRITRRSRALRGDTISEFRRRHADALAGLFVQILDMCRAKGMAKLGRVAIDGSKVRANASKHKAGTSAHSAVPTGRAMSYGRMKKKDAELEKIAKDMFDEAEQVDAEEDALYGKGNRGDPKSRALRGELPEEFRNAKTRRKKIREAIKNLKERKKAQADAKRAEIAEIAEKEKAREEEGKPRRGPKPKEPSDEPDEKMESNFTDPESRIMKMGATGSFEQCYPRVRTSGGSGLRATRRSPLMQIRR